MSDSSMRPHLRLAMIVRDEAAVIERCLGSVRSLIDSWTIIDTGSTDDTPRLVHEALAGIPGELIHRPWRDFASNRNELLDSARAGADYLLLIDADMVLEVATEEPLAGLGADVHMVQVEGGWSYRMPYLVSTQTSCRYVGRTHEYLDVDDAASTRAPFDGFVLHHLADGGSRAQKFQRDLALLEADVRADPDNARAAFYLARTREDLGDAPGALAAYQRRIALGGWDEEVFWSMYRCGLLLDGAGDWPAAAQMLTNAWEFRPSRVEPVLHLARGHRERGACRTALMWATCGVAIPFPESDVLFVERWIYDWGMQLEFAAALWWNGDVARAKAMWNGLLLRDDLPADARASIRKNLQTFT